MGASNLKYRMIAAVMIMAAAVGCEAFARLGIGLGAAPVVVTHPTIEYMFAPNQDTWPFHHHFSTNEYGMRSPMLASDRRHRVLVLGDSVINGGNLTDQAELATTLLSDEANLYLNASAGSWGPENMLAYVKAFGTFGADRMVLVISSHDLSDYPTFAPLNPTTHPTDRPLIALLEGVTRYLPRLLPIPVAAPPSSEPTRPPSTTAISSLLDISNAAGMRFCIVMHRTLEERGKRPPPAFEAIRELAPDAIDDGDFLKDSDYRDDIHPNATGQIAIARAIAACMIQ